MRISLPIVLASCACIFLFFWLGSVFISNPQADLIPLRPPTWDEAKWWLGRPDTGWYIGIAEEGYKAAPYSSAETANWAFFPAYPLLLRMLVHGRSPETYLLTGFCLSLLFYAAAVWLLGRLLLEDYDPDTVTRTLILLCFYPLAYSLAVFGPDSMLLTTVCAAFLAARRGKWALAGLAAGIACVTRVQGALVLPCLVYMYFRNERFGWRSFAPLLAAPAGLAAFSFHLWRLTGNPLAFAGIERAWNNAPTWPFAFLVHYFREPTLIAHSGWDPELLTVTVTCALVPLLIGSWRAGFPRMEYRLFFALQLVVLTCRTSAMSNLRYVTGCFPAFLALAVLVKRPAAFSVLVALFAGFLGLLAALFAAGQQHHPGYHFAAF